MIAGDRVRLIWVATVRPVDIQPGCEIVVDGIWRTVDRVERKRGLFSTRYRVHLRGGKLAGLREVIEFGPAAEVKWRAGS